jgi:hypothetical protein
VRQSIISCEVNLYQEPPSLRRPCGSGPDECTTARTRLPCQQYILITFHVLLSPSSSGPTVAAGLPLHASWRGQFILSSGRHNSQTPWSSVTQEGARTEVITRAYIRLVIQSGTVAKRSQKARQLEDSGDKLQSSRACWREFRGLSERELRCALRQGMSGCISARQRKAKHCRAAAGQDERCAG